MKMRLSHLVFAFLLSTVCMVDAAWADDVDEDVHRVEVFLTGDVSYRVLKITRVDFDGDDSVTPKLIPSTSHAVAPGGALGIKLWFLSLALRGDVGFFDSSRGDAFDGQFRMYNLDLEVAFRAPLGRVEPYLLFGGGYSGLGGLSRVVSGSRRTASSQGGNARVGIGCDFMLGKYGLLGLRGTMDAVFLSSSVPVRELLTPEQVDTVGEAKERAREADGLVGGYAAAITLVAGLRL